MLLPVLVIVHPHFTAPGGAGTVALELGARLTTRFKVVALAQQVDSSWQQRYPNIEFISVHGPTTNRWLFWLLWPWWYCKTARQLNRLCQHYSVTMFNNVFPAHWFGLLYKRWHRSVKAVWYCHEPSAFIYSQAWQAAIPQASKRVLAVWLRPLLAGVDRWLVRQADQIFTNSEVTTQAIHTIYGRTSVVIYPGVNAAAYHVLPYEQKQNTILTVGRLTAFKRTDVLIAAFAQAQLPNVQLQIIGDGEERVTLQRLIEHLQLQDKAHILTNVSDAALKEWYAQARLVVHCSKNEPFGMVITEALVSGTPVLADNTGGPREIIIAGQTGELIDCTVEQLAAALQRFFAQPELLKRYSQQARSLTEQRFNWNTSANLLAAYL